MKKIYTILLVITSTLLSSCFKDYDEKIIGNWQLEDVDKVGFGNSSSNLPFRDGFFSFMEGGDLQYTTLNGQVYQGTWRIRNENNGEDATQSLHITAVNFTTQEVRSEFFNDMNFTRKGRFKAYVNSGSSTYVFYFNRQ